MTKPPIILATLADATEQEVFEQSVRHLLTQKIKSVEFRGFHADRSPVYSCLYKHGNLACAAGCFLSETEYHEYLEGGDWAKLIKRTGSSEAHGDLISRLQSIHDWSKPSDWVFKLISLGLDKGLNISFISLEFPNGTKFTV